MNIDERLAALTMNLELLSRDREDDKRRQEAIWQAMQEQSKQIAQQFEQQSKQIEQQGTQIRALYLIAEEHTKSLDKDAENIRALARVAELHDRRITGLKG